MLYVYVESWVCMKALHTDVLPSETVIPTLFLQDKHVIILFHVACTRKQVFYSMRSFTDHR